MNEYSCPICGGKTTSHTHGYVCEQCGHVLPVSNQATATDNKCPYKYCSFPECDHECGYTGEELNNGGLYGWICPKCGAVLSPWTDCCPTCTQREWKITCGTGDTQIIAMGGPSNLARCRKCVHEATCSEGKDYNGTCPDYKRDAPDGGYYG